MCVSIFLLYVPETIVVRFVVSMSSVLFFAVSMVGVSMLVSIFVGLLMIGVCMFVFIYVQCAFLYLSMFSVSMQYVCLLVFRVYLCSVCLCSVCLCSVYLCSVCLCLVWFCLVCLCFQFSFFCVLIIDLFILFSYSWI